ncbi:MAG: DUF3179 domain-containing protein [Acidobacteria bacterium]|nr:DUF3179 domain-containing protein [Acidobacteriota bacterium]
MCGTGVGFDPVIGGRRLTFDFYGIYNGEFVFYDRQTESVWSLTGGFALDGPLRGQRLTMVPVLHTTWGTWRQLHGWRGLEAPASSAGTSWLRPR